MPRRTVDELVYIQRRQLQAADEMIRLYYATVPDKVLAEWVGVGTATVRNRAKRMGLQKVRLPRYKNGQTIAYGDWKQMRKRIRREFPTLDSKGIRRLARDLEMSEEQLRKRAKELGVKRSEESIRADRANKPNRKYTPDILADFSRYYPTHTCSQCAERFGMPVKSVYAYAYRLGLHKTPGYMRQKQRRAARAPRPNRRKKKGE